ncbi:MAG: hypothetical protein PHG97_02525 [Candidatus Margulisbacteria bacterium]|nr:hypothetical protein [Candidatus Margulisiibacteriota bacterium]
MAVEGPLNANMDKLNNGDWGKNIDAKTANMKFQQTMMANFFKQHVEKTAKESKKKNE